MRTLPWFTLALVLGACDDGSGDKDAADDSGDLIPADYDPDPYCTDPQAIACSTGLILEYRYVEYPPNSTQHTETIEGDDFVTVIDATAGGLEYQDSWSWYYMKFTPDGAKKLEESDTEAMESMDWDIAFKRLGVRVNSGTSGPSCVSVHHSDDAYAAVDDLPAEDLLSFESEAAYYYDTSSCEPNFNATVDSPYSVMDPWREWDTCARTTGVTHLIRLADGHTVKVWIESVYGGGQDNCNDLGLPGTDLGIYTIRWRYLYPSGSSVFE